MKKNQYNFENRTALVTGGAQGFGLDITKRFLDSGAKVVIWDIDDKVLDKTKKDVNNVNLISDIVDVSVYKDVEKAASKILSNSNIDILINNAGINVFSEPLKMSDDEWKRAFSVDLDGVWYGCKAVLPFMLEKGKGSIVNISSVHGFQIIPNCFPYPVAKHGVIGLTRALAVDYAAKGIKINCISPGYTDTPILERFFSTKPDPEAARKEAEFRQPIRRMGTTTEIANTILFMSSY